MYLEEDVISKDLETRLVQHLDSFEWQKKDNRRVQSYGYYLDYRTRELLDATPPGGPLLELIDLLDSKRMIGMRLQCFVNEYKYYSCIKSHIDPMEFGDAVAVFSLLDQGVLDFTNPITLVKKRVELKPRSLLVFESDYRWKYHHSIQRREIPDKEYRRISITFRCIR